MQRLKQHNIGMHLRLTEDEFLVAQGPVFPNRGTVRRVRMRVERSGYAERSYHELAPQHSVFTHCSTQFGSPELTSLATALQVAQGTTDANAGEDPSGVFRVIEFWGREQAIRLCVEYVRGEAVPPAPAFEAVWDLLAARYPGLE